MIEVTHKVTRESARQKKFDPQYRRHTLSIGIGRGHDGQKRSVEPTPAECGTDSDNASGGIREEYQLPTDPLPKHVVRE